MTRGHAGAASRLQTMTPWKISVITYMELMQGCRNRQEWERFKQGLAQCQTEILSITEVITSRAMKLVEVYALSYGVQLGDALIAATALEQGLTVFTASKKHFGAIEGLEIEVFMP